MPEPRSDDERADRTPVRGPVRTCVGCRQRAPRAALLRVTACGGTLQLDVTKRAAGRGAYLHPRAGCLEAFARKGGFVRSLRCVIAKLEREALRARFPEVRG